MSDVGEAVEKSRPKRGRNAADAIDAEFAKAEEWLRKEHERLKAKGLVVEEIPAEKTPPQVRTETCFTQSVLHTVLLFQTVQPQKPTSTKVNHTVAATPPEPLKPSASTSSVPPKRNLTKAQSVRGGRKPLTKEVKSTIGENSRERRVPGSRLGRMASFGSLGFGLGVGALAEVTRRGLGFNKPSETGSF